MDAPERRAVSSPHRARPRARRLGPPDLCRVPQLSAPAGTRNPWSANEIWPSGFVQYRVQAWINRRLRASGFRLPTQLDGDHKQPRPAPPWPSSRLRAAAARTPGCRHKRRRIAGERHRDSRSERRRSRQLNRLACNWHFSIRVGRWRCPARRPRVDGVSRLHMLAVQALSLTGPRDPVFRACYCWEPGDSRSTRATIKFEASS